MRPKLPDRVLNFSSGDHAASLRPNERVFVKFIGAWSSVRPRAAACKLELARIHSSAVTNGTFMTLDPRKPRAGLVC